MKAVRFDVKANRIEYAEEHWYEIDGQYYPSVTMILDVIAKGYGYDEWLKSVSLNASYIARIAADKGTRIHRAIEQITMGEKIKNELEEYEFEVWEKICQWHEWFTGLKVKPIASEQIVFSKSLGVAGTLDLVCEIEDKIYVLDYKTGGQYDSHDLQVAAYRHCMEEMGLTKETGKIDECGMVYIGAGTRTKKELNYPGVKVQLIDYDNSLKVFKHAVDVWKWKNPTAQPKNKVYPLELKI